MALNVWQRHIVTDAGNVIAEAEVEVFLAGTTTNASLFEDEDGAVGLANPFDATAAGFARFYIADGKYDIKATGGGDTLTWENVQLGVLPEEIAYTGAASPAGPGTTTVDGALDAAFTRIDNSWGFSTKAETVAEIQAASYLSILQKLWLDGFTGPGTGGGPLYRDAADTTTPDNGGTVFVDADGVRWKAAPGFVVGANTTINIPTDYATLQAAVDALSQLRTIQGVTIDLKFEAGHNPTSGLSIANGDFSHFSISSVDATLTLDGTFSGDFIDADHAIAPVLNCYVDGNSVADRCYDMTNSLGKVNASCGGTNFTDRVLYANNSFVNAGESIWRNSLRVYGNNAAIQLGSAVISGMTDTGGALYASRTTTVECQLLDMSDCAGGIIATSRATVNAREATLDNMSGTFLSVRRGGSIDFEQGVAADVNALAVDCLDGEIGIRSASFTPSGTHSGNAVEIRAGRVEGALCSISGFAGDGVQMLTGSWANFGDATITNNGGAGIRALDNSHANAEGATVTGNATNQDLLIGRGSTIVISNGATSSGAGSPSTTDANVTAFNAIDGNKGIIWN